MNKRIAVLLPCYKRPEYTAKCIAALEAAQEYDKGVQFYLVDDGSQDGTSNILVNAKLPSSVHLKPTNIGLRNIVIEFFEYARTLEYDYIVKMDNDCLVPKNWLREIIAFLETGWADVVSPNVHPSDAAMVHGNAENPEQPGIRPSKIVGGLWAMHTSLLKDIFFEPVSAGGIKGAWHLLNQILVEKEPRVGWLPGVIVQDIGHWSGQHPDHIKSTEHLEYSIEVGRRVAWA